MAHSYTQLLYHLVFSTKERHPWIDVEIAPQLYEYLGGAIRDEGGMTIEIGGITDHVPILARLRQDRALSEVVRAIKANSSGWIHRTFPARQDCWWQSGYAAFTVSKSQEERVSKYIQNQQEHHRKTTFQEEFVALLKAHEIEFDERYVWT